MARLEETLGQLAAVPGVRVAALAGFDGLLVDHAYGAVAEQAALASGATGAGPRVDHARLGLEGTVVEMTHAWNALRRAAVEHLAAGGVRAWTVETEAGTLLAHAVADRWFVWVWSEVGADLDATRAALRESAASLVEVVA